MGVQGLNNALNPPGAPHVRTQPLNQVTQPQPHPPLQDQDPDLVQSQDLEPDLQVNPDDQVQGATVPTEPQGEEPKAIFLFDIAPRIHNVYQEPLTFHFGKKKLVTRFQVMVALETAKKESGESIWSKVKPYVVDMLVSLRFIVRWIRQSRMRVWEQRSEVARWTVPSLKVR